MSLVDPDITEWRDRKGTASLDEWLSKCDQLWDIQRGELASDYPYFPWHDWYDHGYTVEYAVELAEETLFGYEPRPWEVYLSSIGWSESDL